MEFVERILGKIVGEELVAEELQLVSGGLIDTCGPEQTRTWADSTTFADCE